MEPSSDPGLDAEGQAIYQDLLLPVMATQAYQDQLAAAQLTTHLHHLLHSRAITPADITLDQENQLLTFSIWAANTDEPDAAEVREFGRYARELADAAAAWRRQDC